MALISVSVGVSFFCLSLARADEGLIVPIDWVRTLLAEAASAVHPSPAPSASPAAGRRHSFLGRGPIELSGLGNVDLNTKRSGRNGLTDGSTGYLSSGQVSLTRRTDAAVLSVSQGLGYSSGQTSYGQIQANYRTPTYALDYGAVAGSSDTQLQIGGFARGLRYSHPTPDGSIEFIAAAAFQQDATGFRAFGLRRFIQHKKTSEALTVLNENALTSAASNRIIDYVLKEYAQQGTAAIEVALARPSGINLAPDESQVAFGASIDHSSKQGYASLSLTAEPHGFTSLNEVTFPLEQLQASLRRDLGRATSLSVNLGADDQTINGTFETDRRGTLTLTTQAAGVGITLLDNLSTSNAPDQTTINRGLGGSLNETILGTALSETYQTATANGSGGLATNSLIAFNESRNVGKRGYLTLSQSFGRSSSQGAVGKFSDEEFSYTKTLGKKLDVSLGLGVQRQTTNNVTIPTTVTSIAVTRRISNVVALRVTSAVSRQGGPSPGTSTSFSADLVGPFAFGSAAAATGRPNPNLPATIRGHIITVSNQSDFFANASQQRGYGNVLVILDGTITQRSDSSGEYEFRFVKPGIHTVAIEQSSLAGGLVADRQRLSLTVQGGQIQTVDFTVGNFAGVAGRVFTKINGVEAGIPDVVVTIDDLQRVVTDEDGRYSIGRLTPGSHRIQVDAATLPSNAQLDGGFAAKTVTAVTGTIVTADFRAQRLGSISGTVLFTTENGFGDLKGAKDVYVVANPGDHAAITDADGAFIIDNLPPGKYTLTVDKDTLPDGQDVIQGPDDAVDVVPESKVNGITFKLGSEAKEVVYTFNGAKKAPISMTTDIEKAPPGALVHIAVKAGGKPKSVRIETDNFGNFALKETTPGSWTGAFVIPPTIARGEYAIHAALDNDEKGADTTITVDPHLALSTIRFSPAHPTPGRSIHVVARLLGPVGEGDELRFPDGYTIKLPKPNGRIFSFDVRLWTRGLPYDGSIVTKTHVVFPFSLRP